MQIKRRAIRIALVAAFFAPALLATAQGGGAGGSTEKAIHVPGKTITATATDLLMHDQAPPSAGVKHRQNKSRKITHKSDAVLPKQTTGGKN